MVVYKNTSLSVDLQLPHGKLYRQGINVDTVYLHKAIAARASGVRA